MSPLVREKFISREVKINYLRLMPLSYRNDFAAAIWHKGDDIRFFAW